MKNSFSHFGCLRCKWYIISLIAFLPVCGICMAQDKGFTTRFEISGLPDSTRFEVRIHDGENFSDARFDTIYMVNGKAELRDVSKAKDPVRAYAFSDYGVISIFVQNGHTELVSGDKADIEKETLRYKGAPWSEDFMSYNLEIGILMNELKEKGRNFGSMNDEEKREYSEQSKKIASLEKEFYLSHPNSWHTLAMMESYHMMEIPKEDLRKLYNQLLPEQRNSSYGQTIKRYLDVRSIEKGDSLKDFNIIAKDQNGNQFNLMELNEPYILLDFSQLYCGPCKAAAKEIHEIKEKYADKVAFVNFSCDDNEEDWQEMVKRDKNTWPSLFNGGSRGTVCLKYNVNSYPTFFLFGPDRTLIDITNGYGKGMLDMYLSSFVKKD